MLWPCKRRVAGRSRRSPWWPREPDRARARSAAGAGAAGGLFRADRRGAGTVALFAAVVWEQPGGRRYGLGVVEGGQTCRASTVATLVIYW
jgi:hypothetical protein